MTGELAFLLTTRSFGHIYTKLSGDRGFRICHKLPVVCYLLFNSIIPYPVNHFYQSEQYLSLYDVIVAGKVSMADQQGGEIYLLFRPFGRVTLGDRCADTSIWFVMLLERRPTLSR